MDFGFGGQLVTFSQRAHVLHNNMRRQYYKVVPLLVSSFPLAVQMFLVLQVKIKVWLMATAFSYGINLCNQCRLAAKEGMKLLRWSNVQVRVCAEPVLFCEPSRQKPHEGLHKGQQIAFKDNGKCKLLVFI